MNLLAAFAPSQARESLAVVGRMLSSPQDTTVSQRLFTTLLPPAFETPAVVR